MYEDLTKDLLFFGLSINQSRVYLSILQEGSSSVTELAKISNVHRQDIYKILVPLEKKGLITRTLGTPIMVKAIPPKIALENLVSVKQNESKTRITSMKDRLKVLSTKLEQLSKQRAKNDDDDEIYYILLTEDNEISNKADLLFQKARMQCDIVASIELLSLRRSQFYRRFLEATENGAKIRLIIESGTMEENTKEVVEAVSVDSNFDVRLVIGRSPKPFIVRDKQEVWIATSKRLPSGLYFVLSSNGQNLVETYQERFERLWTSQEAITILPKIALAEKKGS